MALDISPTSVCEHCGEPWKNGDVVIVVNYGRGVRLYHVGGCEASADTVTDCPVGGTQAAMTW